jgi:hypothetical protein
MPKWLENMDVNKEDLFVSTVVLDTIVRRDLGIFFSF